jgi:hypothetical protein
MNLPFINTRFLASLLFLGVLCTVELSADVPAGRSTLPSDQQIIAFLTESVDWFRHLSVEKQIATEPADLLFLYDNQPIARQIVQLSLDFARADASLAAISTTSRERQQSASTADSSSPEITHLVQLERNAEQASRETTQDIQTLNAELLKAHRAERKKLQAALDESQSRLQLLGAGSASLRNLLEILRTSGSSNSGNGNLASIIEDLARTVPEATGLTTAPASMQNPDPPSIPKPRAPGILGLASELSGLQRKLRIVNEEMRLTDALAASSENLRHPLIGFINTVLQSGNVKGLQASDLRVLEQQRNQLDDLAVQLKALSPAIVALDKQMGLLTTYKSHLAGWRATVVDQNEKVWKDLIIRLVIVAVIIATLALVELTLRRVTMTHVRDANRSRVIMVIQRVVIWSSIILVGAFAFASDLSSLATFFGLLTAGVAVALQSVIVASLGYFVLVGKRGIRIGDRVRISGVTGNVIDIGLLQFQVREFDTQAQELTNNIVTFSNSFVFVSPATGLLRFWPDNPKVNQPEVLEESRRQ